MIQKELDGKALCKAIRAAGGDHLVVKANGEALLFCDESYFKKVLKLSIALIVKTSPGYEWIPCITNITQKLSYTVVYSGGFNYVLRADSLEAFNAAMAQLEGEELPKAESNTLLLYLLM